MGRVPSTKKGEGQECVFRVVRVCGTIRKAEEEVVRRARADILRVRQGNGKSLEDVLGSGGEGVEEVGRGEKRKRVVDDDDDDDEAEGGEDLEDDSNEAASNG